MKSGPLAMHCRRKIDNVIEESNVTEVDMTEAEAEEALKEDMGTRKQSKLVRQQVTLMRLGRITQTRFSNLEAKK